MNTAPRATPPVGGSRAFPPRSRIALCPIAAALLALGPAASAWGAPQGGELRAGSATISQSGSRTDIVQTSPRAVIDWRSFGIDAAEHVRFAQPSASASTLNRVTGDQASRILGQLTANGRVILINPNGIVFGRGARVDVGSLIATTSRLGDDRLQGYMERGVLEFEPGRTGAGIVQSGTITAAEGGLVALVAPHVRNDGFIQARLGRVTLASGDRYTIDLAGDGLVNLALSDAHAGTLTDPDGNAVRALVDQAGQINVAGGQTLLLSAGAAKAIVDNVINMSGVIQADTAGRDGTGTIVLEARSGPVAVSGQLLARGREDGQHGGSIAVRTGELRLADSAYFDAGGSADAGTVALSGLARIGQTEAEVISRTLRTGSHSTAASAAGMEIDASIDGRGGASGASLTLHSVDDLLVRRDLLTQDGALRLVSSQGAITIDEQPSAIDGERVHPILFAGNAAIELHGHRSVKTHDLITSGDIAVVSTTGSVAIGASLGYSFNGPIGSLTVRAESSDPASPGDAMLMDVQVAPTGHVDVAAYRNVQLFLPDGAPPDGLLASPNVSFRSTLMGDLWTHPAYPERAGAQFLGPGSDGEWTTLEDNELSADAVVPGITPPGPTANLPPPLALREIAPAQLPEVLGLANDPTAPILLPPSALVPLPPNTGISLEDPAVPPIGSESPFANQGVEGAASGAVSPFQGPASDPPPQEAIAAIASLSDAERDAALRQDGFGPASGGQGVAREADLGRANSPGGMSDVFEQGTHVVEGPACDLDNGGIHTYFGSDAFGHAIAVNCR
jgi:filamentous hemagglutinin family protein